MQLKGNESKKGKKILSCGEAIPILIDRMRK